MENGKNTQQPKPKDNMRPWSDPCYRELRKLFSQDHIRDVLTHDSFYADDQEKSGFHRGNSRYVFAGMTVFKGQVADILYRYFSGSGTQLQHILGNLFRNEYLERLFDGWKLQSMVRFGGNFNVQSHRHIFVYAIFGYVSQQKEHIRNWFVFRYILNDDTRHIFEHDIRNKDILAQVNYIARQTSGKRLQIVMSTTEEGLNRATAVLDDGSVICEATSKSWQYARRKAARIALNILATPGRRVMLSNPEYQARIQKERDEKRAAREAEVAARDQARAEMRQQKAEKHALEKRLRDEKRRQIQAEAKKRKAVKATRAEAKEAKGTRPMSANKRQYLEDKQK